MEFTACLKRAIKTSGHVPKYIVSDKGPQFWCSPFKRWCRRHNIRPRFGAVGKYGSIALIERFIRSLKAECTRRILIPLRQAAMQQELGLYLRWFHLERPHQGLAGLTPNERLQRIRSTSRYCWKRPSLPELVLDVTFLEGRPHLPIVRLHKAA